MHRFVVWLGVILVFFGFLVNCGGGSGSESVAPLALVSVSTDGTEANVDSNGPVLSFNGRYVVFYTDSDNLAPDDTNDSTDVFIRDMDLGLTSRVSVSTAGTGGNDYSTDPAISYNGRYVVFYSGATNLVPNDNNGKTDVFLRDTVDGITSLVSVSTTGTVANNECGHPAISGNGRYVSFSSYASNLVAGDYNGHSDVFLRDTVDGITSLVSVSTAGTQGNHGSFDSAISSDGRYVAFRSGDTNLVPGDNNGQYDIFLRDTIGEITSLVSVSTAGTQGNAESEIPAISSDGRYVVFSSYASNLVPDDTNNLVDIFLRDTVAGTTTRVSVNSAGEEANNVSENPSVSADGRYVVFYSWATNLVQDDNNLKADTFVHDTVTGTTTRVSLSSTGGELSSDSIYPSISPDGRYVAFKTSAVDILEGETLSGIAHVFRAPRP